MDQREQVGNPAPRKEFDRSPIASYTEEALYFDNAVAIPIVTIRPEKRSVPSLSPPSRAESCHG
jgi:hypothetical protein